MDKLGFTCGLLPVSSCIVKRYMQAYVCVDNFVVKGSCRDLYDFFVQLKGHTKEKASNKMDIGIWLGKTCETDEHYMGTSDGIVTARTCRRMASDEQWSLDTVKAVTGVPWNTGTGRLIGRPRQARVQVQPTLPAASTHCQPPEAEAPAVSESAADHPSVPSDLVSMTPVAMDDEDTSHQERRKGEKRGPSMRVYWGQTMD